MTEFENNGQAPFPSQDGKLREQRAAVPDTKGGKRQRKQKKEESDPSGRPVVFCGMFGLIACHGIFLFSIIFSYFTTFLRICQRLLLPFCKKGRKR